MYDVVTMQALLTLCVVWLTCAGHAWLTFTLLPLPSKAACLSLPRTVRCLYELCILSILTTPCKLATMLLTGAASLNWKRRSCIFDVLLFISISESPYRHSCAFSLLTLCVWLQLPAMTKWLDLCVFDRYCKDYCFASSSKVETDLCIVDLNIIAKMTRIRHKQLD